jgi:hypothetical protein
MAPIKGLHSIAQKGKGLPHVIIDEKATMLVDDLMSKQTTQKPIKLKGEKVHKTYCNDVAELAVLSKKHPL